MKLFILILGGTLVGWGILQRTVFVLVIQDWNRKRSRISQMLLWLILLPTALLLDLLDRPARPLSVPRGWFIGDIPMGIFIVFGLLLLGLGAALG